MPTGKEQVEEHFSGEGEDEHEKIPWDGGRSVWNHL